MRLRFTLRALALAGLVAGGIGCGGSHRPAPLPAEGLQCDGAQCTLLPWKDIQSVDATDGGLEVQFGEGVQRREAIGTLFHCHEIHTDNPRLPTMVCPMNLGPFTLNVAEGPVGVTLMLSTDDDRVTEALHQWYEAHKGGFDALDPGLLTER